MPPSLPFFLLPWSLERLAVIQKQASPKASSCPGVGPRGMEGCALLWPLVSWAATVAEAAVLGPKGKLAGAEAGSIGQRQLWAGTNRVPVCFFPSAAAASRPGAVFSVEGAPENRAGKSLVAAHLPVPTWALRPGYQGTKGRVFSHRPLRPRCRGH